MKQPEKLIPALRLTRAELRKVLVHDAVALAIALVVEYGLEQFLEWKVAAALVVSGMWVFARRWGWPKDYDSRWTDVR